MFEIVCDHLIGSHLVRRKWKLHPRIMRVGQR